jgi:hypothetical protein
VQNPRANATPPIKYVKAKNGRPVSSNFKFTPKNFSNLSEYVYNLNWDSVEKKLQMVMSETPRFEVVRWLNFIDDQQHIYQKSPFVDVDNNVIWLDFLDGNNAKVATLRFKNLKVENHNCSLAQGNATFGSESFLRHNVTLSYQYAEMVVHAERIDSDDVDVKDGEWKTVETP